MNLAKDIAFLLYKHNCVIIPSFGAFLVNEKEAERNINAKYANPRSKAISFNAQIVNNDGLIANHLSQKYTYSYEQGVATIQNYVEDLQQKLATKRNAEVSEVGTFYLTKEEKLIFVPYHSVNFQISSYGLPKLRLKTIESRQEVKTVQSQKPVQLRPVALPTQHADTTPKLRNETRLEEQEKKRSFQLGNKVEETKIKEPRSLRWVNVLGSIFILTLLSGIAYIEYTNGKSQSNAYADLLDTPTLDTPSSIENQVEQTNIPEVKEQAAIEPVGEVITQTKAEKKEETTISVPVKKLNLFAVCTEVQADTFAAEKLKEQLIPTFKGAFVWNENGNFRVQIIALSKEKVAKEYLTMAQKKVKQQLVIKEK
ncbi:MAG: hypothetical protein RLZZ337_1585 [Bacteroidota bacterium]|jgi:nucleoid DNA-binding protein